MTYFPSSHRFLPCMINTYVSFRKPTSPRSSSVHTPIKSSPLAIPGKSNPIVNGVKTPTGPRATTPSLSSCPSSPTGTPHTDSESSRDGFGDGDRTAK